MPFAFHAVICCLLLCFKRLRQGVAYISSINPINLVLISFLIISVVI